MCVWCVEGRGGVDLSALEQEAADDCWVCSSPVAAHLSWPCGSLTCGDLTVVLV